MNWDGMSPRERNLLIAKHVFGATPESWPDDWPMGTDEDGSPYPKLPDYSTDIAAAWEVFEAVRQWAADAGLWGPTLYLTAPLKGGKWMVRLKNDMHGGMNEPHTDDTIGIAHADTAPEAICKFALRAKGVEV